MENEPPQEFIDYVKHIAELERENEATKATISVGPFTAFCMISSLQLAVRHPELGGPMKTRIRSVIDQLKPLFADTPAEELINRGDHPEWDIYQPTIPCAKCGTLLDKAKLPPEVAEVGYANVLCRPCWDAVMAQYEAREQESVVMCPNGCGFSVTNCGCSPDESDRG